MKRFVLGLLIACVGLLKLSPVSFSSDGPTTDEVCYVSDYDYSFTDLIDFEKNAPENNMSAIPICSVKCETEYQSNEFAILPAIYVGEKTIHFYPLVNEWRTNKEALLFNSPKLESGHTGNLLSYSFRC